MLSAITSLVILPLLLHQGGINNNDKASQYEVPEAYQVYSAMLPSERPLADGLAKSLLIQTETRGFQMCLRPDKEWEQKIGPAISDYVKVNAKPSLLNRQIDIKIPYQLIMAAQIDTNSNAGWETFYQRYPDSGGWIELSAVGFNNDKTVAVVSMAHHCGALCASGRFHVLEKKNGRWVELDWKGSSCAWMA